MPAVLDKEKPKASRPEAFVEKQIAQARGRIRTLDFFQTGLVLLIGTFAFVFALLLIDRAYETPPGTLWAALGAFVLACAGYVWLALFRPSRRHINPFYAAHQVEQTIPDAKNSVINYVDLEDDASVPASVKASIGARAAKDMKQVDLNRAIQKKTILWLAGIAAVVLIAAVVAAFLPPTRTTIKLLSPSEGDTSVVQGENVLFKVELNGRIPEKGQPDVARVRIWYNPEDPGNFEERILEPVEGERNVYGYVVPAKQVRNGFFYQIFAGNVKTAAHEVKLRIIPQFTGTWEAEYVYPAYLNKKPDKRSDPKLVGYFNTMVTLTAHANRPVKSATLHMQIDGQSPSYPNIPVENDPEAIRFQFPLTRNGRYQIKFVTTEGQENPERPWYGISLVDPVPVIRFFDVTYDYPKYLRYDRTTIVLREPNLEVNRGTEVTLVANANRPIRKAHLELDGVAIAGQLVEGEPTQATFKLPALTKDGVYRVWFTPDTGEADSRPRTFNVRMITDKNPEVEITKPQQIVSELPANGNLGVEGIATDDHGLSKMNLRFEVITPAPNMPLQPKPYRGGVSFMRKEDNSYPNQIEFKDIIELAKLKADGENGAAFSVQPGMEIEYWLEAIDNCDVPPGPNSAISRKLRIKVLAPEMNPVKKQQQDKEKQNLEQEKKQHEKKQDEKNANEKRDPKQPKQEGDPQPQAGEPEPMKGDPKGDPKGEPKQGGMGNMPPNMDQPMDPKAEADLKKQEDEAKAALGKVDPKGGMGGKQADPKDAKIDPNNPNKEEPKDPNKEAPKDPRKDEPKDVDNPKKPEAKPDEKPDPRQLPKPEDVQKLADKLDSKDMKEQEEAREQVKKNIEQAKKDERKPEEAQKQLDEHRKMLDEGERKQFDESLERVAQEIKDIEREKRVNDAVEKLTSGDKQKQQQGQQELENELRDPKSGKDSQRQLQNLAGDMGTERQKQIGDAMNLAKENAKKPPPTAPEQTAMPKEKEPEEEKKDVDELAKKSKKGPEEEKKQAQDQLEKMLRNPATRDKVQQQLEDYKNKIKDKQEREDFEKMMKDIADNAKKDMDPDQRRAEEIKKLAEQLKSDDKKERDAAQKQLEEAMKQTEKDAKAQADAEKQLNDTRNSIKDEKKKADFDQAVKEIKEAVQKHREEKAAAENKSREELDKIAKGLNDKEVAKREEAQRKLEEKLQDPNTREKVKNELDKLKQQGDAANKENIEKATEKALADINRKEGLDKIGKDINSKDPEREKAAKEQIEDMLADPKTRDQVKKDIDKLKDATKDQDAKEKLGKAVADAEKNIETNKREAEQIAKDLNSKNPETQKAAQKKLEEALKDPARGEQVKNELDRLKREAGDAETKQNIDKATQKAMEDIARQRELERLANDLNSKDPERQKAAQQKLENKLADQKTADQTKQDLNKVKESLKSQQAKDKVDDAVEQAEKNIAQNKQEAGKLAQDLTGKDKGKQEAAQQKLEEMLKDPAKREQIKNELERLKQELGDDQAKAKLEEAMKNAENNLAKKEGKSGAPKAEDFEQIARDLNSKDADKEKAAQQKLRDALKDPKTRAKVEKDLNDIKDKLTDQGEKQKLTDALNKAKDDIAKLEKPLDPREIEKLVQDLKSKDPKTAAEAQKKLNEMLDDPDMREKLAKAIDELMKNVRDETARKELDDQLKDVKDRMAKLDKEAPGKTGAVKIPDGKNTGGNTKEPATETASELQKKVKAGELLLEQFKRNITNEEFRKQLGWTDEQIAEFQKKYEQQVAQLKKQLAADEKGELPHPRVTPGGSKLDGGREVKNDPRDGSDPLRSGRGVAPPGFGDAYEKFTTDVSGSERKSPPPPSK